MAECRICGRAAHAVTHQWAPRKSDSRERMLHSTMTLLREYGANATSMDRVLAHSGPRTGRSTTTSPAVGRN